MKIGNLYDLPSFQRFSDNNSLQKIAEKIFQDAYAGAVLDRNLTHVDPQIFEIKYPELAFVNSGLEANNTGGFANVIQSLRLIQLGEFRNAGDRASNKGTISVSAEEQSIKVIEREAESKWTDTEIKQAALQNRNLVNEYITGHNRIYLQEIDSIGFTGGDINKTGLLNNAGFTSTAAAGAASTLGALALYDEIADLIIGQWDSVNNTPEYRANVVVMPTTVWNIIQKAILNTAAGSSTIRTALMANFPGIKWFSTPKAQSVSGTSRTVAYSNNKQVMQMRIPQPLQIGEIVKKGSFAFQVESKYRVAGLDVLVDEGADILTGL